MSTLWEWAVGATMRRLIEQRLAEAERELAARSDHVAAALRGANVHLFFQDADLRYTSVIGSAADGIGAHLLGRTDEQVLPSTEREAAIAIKRRVIATGKPEDCEISYVTPQGRAVLALHIEPVVGADGGVEGISCAAVDLSRVRSL